MSLKAAETMSLSEARAKLDESRGWMRSVLGRLDGLLPERRLRVLEIGAAQGRGLIALASMGHEVCGIEPWPEAIRIAKELARERGVEIRIEEGRAENIPFPDESFDLVLAFSVMEHVADLERSLSEIHRVLAKGGVFWFNSASSLCPVQDEIRGFPLFSWYPDALKDRIMRWAVRARPDLVGYTAAPALHWWTPWNARARLAAAGFSEVWDRWDLRRPEEHRGLARMGLRLAKRTRVGRLIGDVLVPHCAYAARK